MAFDHSLDEQELLQETKEESHWLLMAPPDRFINDEMQVDTAQENARASCMTIWREQFEHTACQNCDLQGVKNTDEGSETTFTHSIDGANGDRVDNNDGPKGR
jgi:hypothetical protein